MFHKWSYSSRLFRLPLTKDFLFVEMDGPAYKMQSPQTFIVQEVALETFHAEKLTQSGIWCCPVDSFLQIVLVNMLLHHHILWYLKKKIQIQTLTNGTTVKVSFDCSKGLQN